MKEHALLVLTRIPSRADAKELSDQTGVVFVGVHSVAQEWVVYRVLCPQGIAESARHLQSHCPGFYNLVPYITEDKASAKILRDSGFVAGERDPLSGSVYATIRFHRDVAPEAAYAVASKFADSVGAYSWYMCNVKGKISALRQLSRQDEVEFVEERNARPPTCVSKGRAMIGVDQAQGIDILTR